MSVTPRQTIELFHLVFLRALVAKGEDKSLFALKGGCNLRFYFRSVRYSEDIDLDVAVVAPQTLQKKVDTLLRSPVVAFPLKSQGVEVVDVSAPKQTETTQRWKAGLRLAGLPTPVRTKIEFSRRSAIEGAAFEPVDADLARGYALPPFLATHYPARRAAVQKMVALASRSTPQSRDVFDLNLLLARPDTADLTVPDAVRAQIPTAIEQAMSLGFDEYAAGVVAFLEPDHAELYGTRAAWDVMQGHVIDRLEQLAR